MKLAPWLQVQLQALLAQRGHAWLLCGPSGLGQFELALALARAWLCEQVSVEGACGHCPSCHAMAVHTHADLCVLIPETLSLELNRPLDEKTQDELDSKKRKPSREIKIEAARQAIGFTQRTSSRGGTKVVLVYPAECMNTATANALLKTLEEPSETVKFILATQAQHQLLPTVRSRCQVHQLHWPDFEQALAWLSEQAGAGATAEQLHGLLAAAGGRAADVLPQLKAHSVEQLYKHWCTLPKAVAQGQAAVLADYTAEQALMVLQKICHDVWACAVGSTPRFFNASDLPKPASLWALASWSKDLMAQARVAEHPYKLDLMLDALAARSQSALRFEGKF